nr:glycine--tRNA ligase subunit beta [Gammaproteobacteria bacterium]
MAESRDLLVEIGTEELPPKSLKRLSQAFGDGISRALDQANLSHREIALFATPRRLAVLVSQLAVHQRSRQMERRGPALSAAFDSQSRPTRAALGFARACGVDVSELGRQESEKGSWLVFRHVDSGRPTAELLPALVEQALTELPVAKRMRWGSLDVEFVRPVHWLVLLFGQQVIEAEIMGVRAGRMTQGHRFHHPQPLMVEQPSAYPSLLAEQGYVIADFARRAARIRQGVQATARAFGGEAHIEEGLLEEVTALVEWPVVLGGSFDQAFLRLPPRVLIATMQGAQRYFPVVDQAGRLLPHFVWIANIDSRAPDLVRRGNERVIRPRLEDAAFFYRADCQRPLASRLEDLEGMVFQERLGSLLEKSQRVSKLAGSVAQNMGMGAEAVEHARRAGLLSKCDLLTEMVGEFPELQGYMGREYALQDGEAEAVAAALEEAYMPRYSGDEIPSTPAGRAVAVADKLDTLVGIFGIGELPTGDKDPFALRRAALGILRILIEGKIDLDLADLIEASANGYDGKLDGQTLIEQTLDFMMDRLRAYFLEHGTGPDVFAAVMARRPTRPYDFARRIWAVDTFRTLPEASGLTAANKRIQNLLKQVGEALPQEVREEQFAEAAERELASKLNAIQTPVKQLLAAGDYASAMQQLASLRDTVDAFFDSVRVLADDETLKANRLALLNSIRALFLETADISQLQC